MEKSWGVNQDNSCTTESGHDYRDHGGGFSDAAARKGPWTAEEDEKLRRCVAEHGVGNWMTIEQWSGLGRTSKSCRLRWINHLRPHLKKGSFSVEEEMVLMKLHKIYGNKWSYIASKLPGRTDNEIKNFWHGRVRRCHRKFLPIYPDNIQNHDESCIHGLEMEGKNHLNDEHLHSSISMGEQTFLHDIQSPTSIFSPQGQSSSNLVNLNRHASNQQFQEQCMLSPHESISNTLVSFTPLRPPPVLSPLVGHFKRFQRTCSPLSSPRTITQFPASESGSGSSVINSAPSDICFSNLNSRNSYKSSMPQSMAWDSFVSEPPSILTPTSAYRPIPEMKTDIEQSNAPTQEQHVKKTKLLNPPDLVSRRLCRKFSDIRWIDKKDSMGEISRREGLLCEISKNGVLLVEREKKETILQGLLDKTATHRVSASTRSKTEDVEGSKRWNFSGNREMHKTKYSMDKKPVEDVVPSCENLESLRYRFHEFKESVSSLNLRNQTGDDQDAFREAPGGISVGHEDHFSTFDLELCEMDILKSCEEEDQQKCSSFSQEVQRDDFMGENLLLDDGFLLLTSNDNQEILLEDIWNSILPSNQEVPSGESLKNVFANNGCNEHLSQKKLQEMQEACNNMVEDLPNIPDWYDVGCESSGISDMVFELEMNYNDELLHPQNPLGFQM